MSVARCAVSDSIFQAAISLAAILLGVSSGHVATISSLSQRKSFPVRTPLLRTATAASASPCADAKHGPLMLSNNGFQVCRSTLTVDATRTYRLDCFTHCPPEQVW